jgi:hypothetical protein
MMTLTVDVSVRLRVPLTIACEVRPVEWDDEPSQADAA